MLEYFRLERFLSFIFHPDFTFQLFSRVQAVRQEGSSFETVDHFHIGTPFWKKMKICLVLLALLVAVACGHNKDGGSYSAKKADKLSFKESLIEKIHNIKDKIHAKISSKKATKAAKKAQKHVDLIGNLDRGAQPAADCSIVLDDVWEEQCGTKYEPVCRMEMQPHCTSIQAKECAPEAQSR